MTKFQILFLLLILPITSAYAQSERPALTWAGGGLIVTHSTAEGGGTVAGAEIQTAYDLRHGFQARFGGEWRRRPVIPRLFLGDDDVLIPTSEIRYGGALIYHVPAEGQIRPFVGGGVFANRQFFKVNRDPAVTEGAAEIYDSTTNPTLILGAGIGRNSELTFTKYFTDTYSYSNLHGYGFDFSRVQRLSGRLHLRYGVEFRKWSYREGMEKYRERSSELSGRVGFQVR